MAITVKNPLSPALSEHTTQIDGITYKATAWPFDAASQMQIRLSKAFGVWGSAQILGAYSQDKSKEEANPEDDANKGAQLLQLMARCAADEGTSPSDYNALLREILSGIKCGQISVGETTTEGELGPHLDTHFMGRYDHMARVFAWATRACFTRPQAGAR